MHGHKYVIETFVAVATFDPPGAVVVFTSDTDDLTKPLAAYLRITVQLI